MLKRVLFSMALLISGAANSQTIGSWTFSQAKSDFPYQAAITTNESGSTAGVLCDEHGKDCAAFVAIDLRCEEKAKYPLLVHSALGAYHVTGTCLVLNKKYFYDLSDFAIMKDVYQSGGEIGFAIPVAGGEFRVLRFDTKGATQTINAAQSPAPTRPRGSQKSGFKDTVM